MKLPCLLLICLFVVLAGFFATVDRMAMSFTCALLVVLPVFALIIYDEGSKP